ncbi:chromate transporter [Rhodopila sp.]|uniref:chromate transporter n=1 Tax=Rhodopila sp. TaxID=2480087 RepID=UPI003D0CAC66
MNDRAAPPATSDVGGTLAPAEPPSLLKLASTFNGIALASFGGGLSAWSREIVVTRRGWLTEAEFLSAMMLCRLLPGANQVNVAVFVGARMRGALGALAAVLGLITVPFGIILLLIAFAAQQETPAIRHVMAGLTAAGVALTLSMVWHTGRKSLTSAVPLGLAALTAILSGVVRAPLWVTLLLLGSAGIAWAWRRGLPAAG